MCMPELQLQHKDKNYEKLEIISNATNLTIIPSNSCVMLLDDRFI